MKRFEVESKEQTFPYEDYMIDLRFNDYNGYWYYNITSETKSMYGVSLRVDEFAGRNLQYLEMPFLMIIDSNPTSSYGYDIKKDLGGRLKLILIEVGDLNG